jgi:hypothetical protein
VVEQRFSRFLLGVVLALAGHALAIGVGFLAGQFVEPAEGGGFEDLAAVVLSFLAVEAVTTLASLIAGVVLLVKGRRDLGAGLLVGWVLGVGGVWLFIQVNST